MKVFVKSIASFFGLNKCTNMRRFQRHKASTPGAQLSFVGMSMSTLFDFGNNRPGHKVSKKITFPI